MQICICWWFSLSLYFFTVSDICVIKTTGSAGGLLCGCNPLLPASAIAHWNDCHSHHFFWLLLKQLIFLFTYYLTIFYLPLFVGSPVNGSNSSFISSCSDVLSSINWFRIYFSIAVLFLPIFLLISVHIILVIFFLLLFLFFRRLFAIYTLVQTLYDICNSI